MKTIREAKRYLKRKWGSLESESSRENIEKTYRTLLKKQYNNVGYAYIPDEVEIELMVDWELRNKRPRFFQREFLESEHSESEHSESELEQNDLSEMILFDDTKGLDIFFKRPESECSERSASNLLQKYIAHCKKHYPAFRNYKLTESQWWLVLTLDKWVQKNFINTLFMPDLLGTQETQEYFKEYYNNIPDFEIREREIEKGFNWIGTKCERCKKCVTYTTYTYALTKMRDDNNSRIQVILELCYNCVMISRCSGLVNSRRIALSSDTIRDITKYMNIDCLDNEAIRTIKKMNLSDSIESGDFSRFPQQYNYHIVSKEGKCHFAIPFYLPENVYSQAPAIPANVNFETVYQISDLTSLN